MTTLYSQTTVQINGATCDAFVSAELKGDLTEVPGVGRAAVVAFTNAGIDDTKALLRQFLKLRKVGMSVQEWQNAMAQYLETIGVIAHRSGVVYVCSTRLLSKHRGNRVRQRERRAAESKVNKGGTSKFCIGILIIIAAVVLLVCTGLGSTVARRRMCRRAWYSWDRAVWCGWGHGETVISEYEQFRGLCNMTSTGNVTAVENWISRHSDQRHMLGMACPAPFRYMLIFQWKTQRTYTRGVPPSIDRTPIDF